MARLIPPGEFAVSGPISIEISLTTENFKFVQKAKRKLFSKSPMKIMNVPFYLFSIDVENPYFKTKIGTLKLIPQNPEKFDFQFIEKLKKLGKVECKVDRPIQTYRTMNSYVKHDLEKEITLSEKKKIYARFWDIIPDELGNKWEIKIYKIEGCAFFQGSYYCPDCNDSHEFEETISTFRFTRQIEAIGKWGDIIKNKRLYDK